MANLGAAVLGSAFDGSGLSSGLRRAQSTTSGFISSWSTSLSVALGNMISNAVSGVLSLARRGVSEVIGLMTEGFTAAAELQQFMVAIETLTAAEISRGSVVTETSTVVRKATLNELVAREKLKEAIVDQQKEIELLGREYGVLHPYTLKAQEDMKNLQNQLAAYGFVSDDTVTYLVDMERKTISTSEAMGEAQRQAAELFGEIRRVSLESPYLFQDVTGIYRTQLAYGQTQETAIRMTQAILDASSAFGLQRDQMQRLSINMAQIIRQGKIHGLDLRQLALVGIDLTEVMHDKLGKSIEEVNAELARNPDYMEEVTNAWIEFSEENFGGAAERMAKTVFGLKSSFQDLFTFISADTFTPVLNVIQEPLVEIFETLQWGIDQGFFQQMGADLAEMVGGWTKNFSFTKEDLQGFLDKLNGVKDTLAKVKGYLEIGELALAIHALFGIDWETAKDIEDFFDDVSTAIGNFGDAWEGVKDFFGDVGPAIADFFTIILEAVTPQEVKDAVADPGTTLVNFSLSVKTMGENLATWGPVVAQNIRDLAASIRDEMIPAIQAWPSETAQKFQDFMTWLSTDTSTSDQGGVRALIGFGGALLVIALVGPIVSSVIGGLTTAFAFLATPAGLVVLAFVILAVVVAALAPRLLAMRDALQSLIYILGYIAVNMISVAWQIWNFFVVPLYQAYIFVWRFFIWPLQMAWLGLKWRLSQITDEMWGIIVEATDTFIYDVADAITGFKDGTIEGFGALATEVWTAWDTMWSDIYTAVGEWITEIWKSITTFAQDVIDKFNEIYDALVKHSIVPDMMSDIQASMSGGLSATLTITNDSLDAIEGSYAMMAGNVTDTISLGMIDAAVEVPVASSSSKTYQFNLRGTDLDQAQLMRLIGLTENLYG